MWGGEKKSGLGAHSFLGGLKGGIFIYNKSAIHKKNTTFAQDN